MFVDNNNLSYLLNDKKELFYFPKCFKEQIKAGNFLDKYYERKFQLFNENGVFKKNKISLDGELTLPILRDSLENTTSVGFELTQKCNLKCEYCIHGDLYKNDSKRKNTSINIKHAFALIDYIFDTIKNTPQNNEPFYIKFYGGEPLLEFNKMIQIIDYAEQRGLKNTLGYVMTTNGILIDKYIDYLVKKDFGLSISLDGNKKHNSYRHFSSKEESFETVIKNVNLIKEKYPSFYKNNVNFIVVMHNKNPVEEVEKYFNEYFDKSGDYTELNTDGAKLNVDQKKRFNEILPVTKEIVSIKACKDFIKNYTRRIKIEYADLLANEENKYKPTATCIPFSRSIFLTADSKILPCEKVDHSQFLGEVTEKGVSIDLQEICNKVNTMFEDIKKACGKCGKLWDCNTCVFSLEKKDKNLSCQNYKAENKKNAHFKPIIDILNKDKNILKKIYEYEEF